MKWQWVAELLARAAAVVLGRDPLAVEVSATSQTARLPHEAQGAWVLVSVDSAIGQDVGLRFGDTFSVSVSLSAFSTLASDGTPSSPRTLPHLVVAPGDARMIQLDPDWTHVAAIAADTPSAAGAVRIVRAEPNKGAGLVPWGRE